MGTPAATSMAWHAQAAQDEWQSLWPGLQVQVEAELPSTNAYLMNLGRFDPSPRVVVAESQTQGRGRQGRAWQAAPGTSLTFSLGLSLQPQHGWGGLSLVVGQALAQALQPWAHGHPTTPSAGRLMVKWPNDLWWIHEEGASPRKLGGILIESAMVADEARAWADHRYVVIGIGLNIRPWAPEGLSSGYACTQEFVPQAQAPQVWSSVVPAVLVALRQFEVSGFEALRLAGLDRQCLLGQWVTLSAGAVSEGLAVDIEADGALRVRTRDGREHRVEAGEVSVRPQSPLKGCEP